MIYRSYDDIATVPTIVVDGAAAPSTVLTLSHWPGSGTPERLLRDTSTAIVFAYLDAPALHVDAGYVTNNHFDEDGLLGIFALLDTPFALEHRELLMDAASAGDFGVFRDRRAARIAATIDAFADRDRSPLDRAIFDAPCPAQCAALYRSLLERLPDIVSDVDAYRELWQSDDERYARSVALIDEGVVVIEEQPALDLAVVRIADDVAPFEPLRRAVHASAINNATERTRILLMHRSRAELVYRYESWVQLASRRPHPRVDLAPLVAELNELEGADVWRFDGVSSIVPSLSLAAGVESRITPDEIERRAREALAAGPAAWNPYRTTSVG
jgi:hypothetical protein